MNLETLVKLFNDLSLLDDSQVSLVTYNNAGSLVYRQLGKLVSVPYMDNYFIHPKLKLGLLLPEDLKELKSTLTVIIQDSRLRSGDLNTTLVPFKTIVYSLVPGLIGPQIIYELNYISFTNSIISKFMLLRGNTTTRLMLKLFNNENRKRKSNKSIKDTSTT